MVSQINVATACTLATEDYNWIVFVPTRLHALRMVAKPSSILNLLVRGHGVLRLVGKLPTHLYLFIVCTTMQSWGNLKTVQVVLLVHRTGKMRMHRVTY